MSARGLAMPGPGDEIAPAAPRDAVVLGPLGFYDTLADDSWRRLGATGRFERRRAYQAVSAALALAHQQGAPADRIVALDAARQRIVAEHRATLRWRRSQERRRRLVRVLLIGSEDNAWPW